MKLPGKASMLAALLGGGGVLHMVRPKMYDWLVPPELGNPRRWVLASGVVEIGTAALLVAPATRRLGGWSAAGLLLAFVPAHLHTFRVIPRKPLPMAVAIGRLPLQIPMVTAALDVARGR
ncbi:DoxX family protein [Blastococcus sp. LR1]|uniref:DoxX family protein n=1 Tax=Blastococcus sp. LR1 TaxID=2877000 RepID=UPI001CC8F5B2|nr:DoxX family protein [Blastococcus sp. LR1]MCA0143729.1 DoxX family protein [Blastococcus sp. LR1]